MANTLLDFAIYSAIVLAGGWYVAAKVVAWAIATINGYLLNRAWTFSIREGRKRTRLPHYTLVQGAGMLVNLVALVLLVEVGGLPSLPAQAIALPCSAATTFLANKHWTFRHRHPVAAAPTRA